METKELQSQKANALNKFDKARKAGALNVAWKSPMTVNITWEFNPSCDDPVSDALMQARESWQDLKHYNYPLFVRSAPLSPRAGVLESSPVWDFDELVTTCSRIITTMCGPDPDTDNPVYPHGLCEPYGSIMIQDYITASASAVVCPDSHITMGYGHDGVTAANSDVYVRLSHSIDDDTASRQALDTLGIDPSLIELEFVSAVTNKKVDASFTKRSRMCIMDNYLVQLRGSAGHQPIEPPPAGVTVSGNLPPECEGIMEVKNVIQCSADTSDADAMNAEAHWLETILRAGVPDGTVVSHGPCGAMSSHHSGHCVKYGVAYIVNTEVNVGDTWIQAAKGWVIDDDTYEPSPYKPVDDLHWFIAGMKVGLYSPARQYGWLSIFFHEYMAGTFVNDAKQTAYYAGVFAGYMVVAPMSVALGEIRHIPNSRGGNKPLHYATFSALYPKMYKMAGDSHYNLHPSNRRACYEAIEENPITLPSMIEQLNWMEKIYYTGNWSSGFGGIKYGESCQKARDVAEAIQVLLDAKDASEDENWQMMKDILGAVNICENAVHNNGFFLNKFLEKRAFDIGTSPNLLTLNMTDMFEIFYSATDAWKKRDDVIATRDTTKVSKFAIKYHDSVKPFFHYKHLPHAYEVIESGLVKSDYFASIHTKQIMCGSELCHTCKTMEEKKLQEKIGAQMNTPVPSKAYDMSTPYEESDEDVELYEALVHHYACLGGIHHMGQVDQVFYVSEYLLFAKNLDLTDKPVHIRDIFHKCTMKYAAITSTPWFVKLMPQVFDKITSVISKEE